jgi:hypothetical protein
MMHMPLCGRSSVPRRAVMARLPIHGTQRVRLTHREVEHGGGTEQCDEATKEHEGVLVSGHFHGVGTTRRRDQTSGARTCSDEGILAKSRRHAVHRGPHSIRAAPAPADTSTCEIQKGPSNPITSRFLNE